jgi:hypothetical protein
VGDGENLTVDAKSAFGAEGKIVTIKNGQNVRWAHRPEVYVPIDSPTATAVKALFDRRE